MSTFIINLNDTIAMSDSAVVELAKVISTCQPCVQKAETNCYEVMIVAIVCGAVVLLAIIAAIVISKWHKKEVEVRMTMEREKVANDQEMRQYDALQKETEERNRHLRYFQKSVFDKIIAKKIESQKDANDEDWKNLYKEIVDFVNDIFIKFKA